MARSIWSGAVSFGLVSVPVKLFPAVSSHDVRFHNINPETGARIRQKRVDRTTGEEVNYERIVKGYEVADDTYVVLEPEELRALAPRSTRTIDILDFVDASEIDPVYFARPYYLGPASEASGKPYRLLVEAMQASGKVGIARFVMRTKEYLAAIRPRDEVLVLNTMNHADEVRPAADVEGLDWTRVDVSDRELDMATRLIESLETTFDPTAYADQYRERLLELIETKAEGRTATIRAEERPDGSVIDLMEALERSLSGAAGGGIRYDQLSKSELYELARERDIEGRSQMSKDELVAALADADAAA